MELPVSNVVKPESSDFSEGWDESWGDGWDDEEVPKTPSMPVTPSVSSKGLAPRRATKEDSSMIMSFTSGSIWGFRRSLPPLASGELSY
ncbi:hypothetical protein CRG98_034296 [Punica granatum]|uniref:Uncharacterized protein n=1 Tax=Punica granatum TaxID=22663 RepID=A0A2I0IMV7_PUNGR|nr:hypothetical protein CRG98_034296 [Punica granatum]